MKNTILAAIAALVVAVGFTPAVAQDLNLNSGVRHVGATIAPAQKTPTLVAIGPTAAYTQEEVDHLFKDGCLVGPIETTRGLYDWAERKGVAPCSPKFYSKVDEFIAKESTIGFVTARVAQGWQECVVRKASNRGNNRDSCSTHPFSVATAVPSLYADSNWSTGGDTATTDAMVALGGALILGPGTAATAQALAPNCGKDCPPAIVNQVLSSSTSAAQNVNENAVDVFSGVTVSGAAPCGAACQATAPKK